VAFENMKKDAEFDEIIKKAVEKKEKVKV